MPPLVVNPGQNNPSNFTYSAVAGERFFDIDKSVAVQIAADALSAVPIELNGYVGLNGYRS
jgi:hypothetical protein